MADGVSAVKDHLKRGITGMAGVAGVTMSEIAPCPLIQIAAWPDTLNRTGTEAAHAIGSDSPPGPGGATIGPEGTLLRVEPLKWWLIEHSGIPLIENGVLLDLSQSRVRLHVGGRQAARLLNHILPLDLSVRSFSENTVASTAFHHVGITLWRDSSGFNLFLPRSFAASLCEILTEIAQQYGLEVL